MVGLVQLLVFNGCLLLLLLYETTNSKVWYNI